MLHDKHNQLHVYYMFIMISYASDPVGSMTVTSVMSRQSSRDWIKQTQSETYEPQSQVSLAQQMNGAPGDGRNRNTVPKMIQVATIFQTWRSVAGRR